MSMSVVRHRPIGGELSIGEASSSASKSGDRPRELAIALGEGILFF